MAAPTDSRLGPGLLTIGGTDYGAQISNVTLEPSQDSEDGTPTLGDPDPAPLITESWVLTGEAVQDFGDAEGFLNYCFDNALSEVAFTFEPDSSTPASSVYAGLCLITSMPIGGDVAAQITSAFEFPVVGTPTRTNPATMSGAGAEESEARAARRKRSSVTVAAAAEPAAKRGRKDS